VNDADVQRLVALRRELHRHPELADEERWTAERLSRELDEVGLPWRSVGGTGLVARFDTGVPGPVLLMRADMDALPVHETAEVPFASENPGCMHACGHDAHMAVVATTARLLARRPPARGSVRFVFQPAEERGRGAQAMLDDGLLAELPDWALAFHVWSPFPVGTVGVVVGPAMASVDTFKLQVEGTGTHAAVPEGGIDPVVIASQIVVTAQTLVSRRTSPQQPAVVSFTSFHGGTAYNVIPPSVEVLGTIRCFDDAVRRMLKSELVELSSSLARSMGGRATVEFVEELPCLVNDERFCAIVAEAAGAVVGPSNVTAPKPLLGGEDMSLILQRVPGAMIFLGCGNDEEARFPHHHPAFAVDERALPIGVDLALQVIARVLG